MTTKFTRGPWLVSPCYLDDYDIVHYSVGPINSSDGARFVEDQICQVSSPNEPDAVVESNAHLIAAAPDLYNALETLTTYCEIKGIPTDAAYAALAKSRGEQQ